MGFVFLILLPYKRVPCKAWRLWYIYSSIYFDRAEEIAELKLEPDQLKEWREKRRVGEVQVKLDDEYVDKASGIIDLM